MTDAVTQARQPPSFLRVLLFLAATIVVVAGMRIGAPIVTPILFALVLSLIFSPVYSWLKRRGLPAPLALLIMLVALSILFVGPFAFLSVSIGKFTGSLAFYTTQLDQPTRRAGKATARGVRPRVVDKRHRCRAIARISALHRRGSSASQRGVRCRGVKGCSRSSQPP